MRARRPISLAVILGALPCFGAEPSQSERGETAGASAPAMKVLGDQPRRAERSSDDLPQFSARIYRFTGDDVVGIGSYRGIPTNPNDGGRRPSRMPAQHGVDAAVHDEDVADPPTGLPGHDRAVIISSCVIVWLIFVACAVRYAR